MEKTHYTIRDAVPNDTEALTKMHMQSWRDTYTNEAAGLSREWAEARIAIRVTSENIEKRRARIESAFNSEDFLFRVAENEKGEIIAFVSPFRNETVQRVGALYVAKEYHGTGLAQNLMDQVIDWADPYRPVQLNVATYNERAKAFYRKYGFKEIENSEHITPDAIPVVSMIRKGDKQ